LSDVEFFSIDEGGDVGGDFVADCKGVVEVSSVESVNFRTTAVGSGSLDLRCSPELLLLSGELTVDGFVLGVLTDGALTDGALTDGALTDGALTDGALTGGVLTGGVLTGGAPRDFDVPVEK
jgi:hypothetical protein